MNASFTTETTMSHSKQDTSLTPKPIADAIVGACRSIHRLLEKGGEINGVSSGFRDLDGYTWGFQPGQLIVLAGRPSIGKTALAANIAESIVLPKKGKASPLLFVSLETHAEPIVHQMLLSRARVRSDRLRGGFAGRDEQERLAQTAVELRPAPLYIHSAGSVSTAELRTLCETQEFGLVIVDSIQLLTPTYPAADRWEQLSLIARDLKAVALDLRIPILVTAQLNRDSERERREPRLSDLSETGVLEQVADVIVLLTKPLDAWDGSRITTGEVDLIIAKNRQGPAGKFCLTFTREFARFDDYVHEEKAG